MADGKFEIDPDPGVSGGKFALSSESGVFRECGNCCCTDCSSTVTSCFGTQFNGDKEIIRSGVSESDPLEECYCLADPEDPRSGQGKCNFKCARLDIYGCATHDGSKFVVPTRALPGSGTLVPRTRVVLNTHFPRNSPTGYRAYGGPFCICCPCSYTDCGDCLGHTIWWLPDDHPNDSLNFPPYWWEDCGGTGIGGWFWNGGYQQTYSTSAWWYFTDSEWTAIFDKYDGTLPTAGEKFTLIVYLAFIRHWSTCEDHSSIRLEGVHITCEE